MRQVSKVHFYRYCSDACGLQIPIWLCATAVCILFWIFFLFVKLQIYLHMNILKLPTFLHKDVCIKCTFISMCIHKVTIFPIQSLWISWESTYLFNLTILIFNYFLFYHNSIYIFFFFVASFYFPSSFFPSTQPFSSSNNKPSFDPYGTIFYFKQFLPILFDSMGSENVESHFCTVGYVTLTFWTKFTWVNSVLLLSHHDLHFSYFFFTFFLISSTWS